MALVNAFGDMTLEETQRAALAILEQLLSRTPYPDTAGLGRTTIAGGTLPTVTTVSTVTTVTTVSTLTNQAQMGGYLTTMDQMCQINGVIGSAIRTQIVVS